MTSMENRAEAAVEAVLFAMGGSVTTAQLAAALESTPAEAEVVVRRLMDRCEAEGRGLRIIELDGAFQMCTSASFYENLIRVVKTPKKQVLTDVLMETLAIVAYRQPVTRLEIEKIRGVKSDHAINKLMDYDLIYEVGRLAAPGHPAQFATTEEFLRRFGITGTKALPEVAPEVAQKIRNEVSHEVGETPEEISEEISEQMPDAESAHTSDSEEG